MKKFTSFSIILGMVCTIGYANAYEYYDEEEYCYTDATVGQVCQAIRRTNNVNGGCSQAEAKSKSPCRDAILTKQHARSGHCTWVRKTSSSNPEPSCHVTECKDGYLLWKSKDKKSGKYRSMGHCHSEEWAKEHCICSGKCNPGEMCLPRLVETPETHKPNGAYEDCSCQRIPTLQPEPIQLPVVEEPAKECTYYFSGTIECNGKIVEIKEERAITVPCIEGVETLTEEMFKNDTGKLQQIKDELCNGKTTSDETIPSNTTVVNTTTSDFLAAEKTLDKFIEIAESERSVWKTSEGKFNTTRLASDITAGVVLGTVGGVVTGVIIKKNQVKKGFEALHCTVGGQKVAEWGDEFSVGLRK